MSSAALDRLWLAAAGLNGACAMAVAAYSAHGLEYKAAELADTGSRFQLIHAVALLAIALRADRQSRWLTAAGVLFVAGSAAFSGGLYIHALAGVGMGPLVPLGGSALILGWLAVVGAALAKGAKSG